jgi:hypothetical protein
MLNHAFKFLTTQGKIKMDIIKILNSYRISISSVASAVEDLSGYNKAQCEELYNKLTETKTTLDNDELIYHTRYLIAEIVKCNRDGIPLDMDVIIRDSAISANAFLHRLNYGDFSYIKTVKEKVPTTDPGKVPTTKTEEVPTTKTKKVRTRSSFKKGEVNKITNSIYNNLYHTSTRDQIVKAFVQAGIKESTAMSQYYINVKKFGKPITPGTSKPGRPRKVPTSM